MADDGEEDGERPRIPPQKMDPLYLAHLQYRRRNFDKCADICTTILEKQAKDQAAWYIKTRALTEKVYIDDTELEEEGLAEELMDDNKVASKPRLGTAMSRPATGSTEANPGGRPMTGSGRPLTGFARPSTQSRGTTAGGTRPMTSRPLTASSGRFVRLGTASLVAEPGGPFIRSDRINLTEYAKKGAIARALFGYIMHVENNARRALELAQLASTHEQNKDWWWLAQIGNCNYKIGLLREAEADLRSSLRIEDMIVTTLYLSKIFLRMDQPNKALECYQRSVEKHPGEVALIIGVARVYDALNDTDRAVEEYKRVLQFDAANVEAMACLGSHYFYRDQPEIALRFYRRLLQMGVYNTEIWNNVGLCCFYSQQWDMALGCFEKALALASDDNMADVWYNIGHIGVSVGDIGLAYQAFKLALSVDPNHAEASNNVGVLELYQSNVEQARTEFRSAAALAPHLHEPNFNEGLINYKMGEFESSFKATQAALKSFAGHVESKELLRLLKLHFTTL